MRKNLSIILTILITIGLSISAFFQNWVVVVALGTFFLLVVVSSNYDEIEILKKGYITLKENLNYLKELIDVKADIKRIREDIKMLKKNKKGQSMNDLLKIVQLIFFIIIAVMIYQALT